MSVTQDTDDTQTEPKFESDTWDDLEERREAFEAIVEQDLPLAPEAEAILKALDERAEVEGGDR